MVSYPVMEFYVVISRNRSTGRFTTCASEELTEPLHEGSNLE